MQSTTRIGSGSRKANVGLWIVQTVLAFLFLFAGGMKLVMPAAVLAQQSQLPGVFMKFIGICEVAGGLGLILPRLFGIRIELTPLAAAGLLIIMIGATTVTLLHGQIGPALVPAVVGLLAASVVRGRRGDFRRARQVSVHEVSDQRVLRRAA